MKSAGAGTETDGAGPEAIRVLRIIGRLNVGGPARHVVLLNEGLQQRGFRTWLAHGELSADEGSLEALPAERGLDAMRVPALARRVRPLHDLLAFGRVLRLIFATRPDIVHTHTAKAGAIGRLAASAYNTLRRSRRRVAVVHTYHGNVFTGYFGALSSSSIRVVERLLASLSDRIVVLSPGERQTIVERHHIAPAYKVVTIPLGLDLGPLLAITGRIPALREELGLVDDAVAFGFIGRFAPIKELPMLLRAFAATVKRAPLARLVLVGDGEVREQLVQLASSLGISSCVRFAGWRSDLTMVYGGLDVVALSSRNEGTPASLIEAMAAARPVVATAVGGVPDLVAHDVTGLLVESGDHLAMADGFTRLANSPRDRERLGARGRLAVATCYTQQRLVRDVADLYAAALSERRGMLRVPPSQAVGARRKTV